MSTSSVSRYVGIYSFTIPPSSFLSILRFLSSFYQTSVVYQLQRRVRTLREQLQRRDLHLDLLRRKLSLQEESVKMKSLLQNERDEACLRYVHCHIFYALHSILFRYLCAYIYIDRGSSVRFQGEEVVEANGSFAGANFGGEIEESRIKRTIDGGR